MKRDLILIVLSLAIFFGLVAFDQWEHKRSAELACLAGDVNCQRNADGSLTIYVPVEVKR